MIYFSGGPYAEQKKQYIFEDCLTQGSYIFEIRDSYGDGLINTGGYRFYINDVAIKAGGTYYVGADSNFQFFEKVDFTI